MSKFINGQVFLIMNDADVTTQVINLSLSRKKESMPVKVSGGVTKYIVEFAEPAPDVVAGFTWYSLDEINAAWEALP